MDHPDLWLLYRQMLRSRLFEEAVGVLWAQGLISGEMHLGVGEEGIAAGVVLQMEEGDAMALDHRGTPPLLMRGVDAILLLKEFLGQPEGLCKGMGGHMHLFAPELLAASSGIVGASAPTAVGFALAAQQLRPGKLAVAFFGEGATNQGMLLEALNLAVAWKLPAIFVCKDNDWAITTRSKSVTGSSLTGRARGFGMHALEADGSDVLSVWEAAREAMRRARSGEGPTFIHASCVHLQGHFLGDPLIRLGRNPLGGLETTTLPLLKSFFKGGGAALNERLSSMWQILGVMQAVNEKELNRMDPLVSARLKLTENPARLQALEDEVSEEIQNAVASALQPPAMEKGGTP